MLFFFICSKCNLIIVCDLLIDIYISNHTVSRVSSDELCDFYRTSCVKHKTEPLEVVLNHLESLDYMDESRALILDLHNQLLTHENVETLEEILKRVSFLLM